MTLAVWWKTRRLVRERRIRAKTESGDGDAKLAKLKSLVRVGALCSAVGYALWNVDMYFCEPLIGARRAVGQPLGYLLELHGW
ncbi:hypothetical protein B0J12DRAFT_691575 [Macrophomina phaseolina]|uniref:Major facilitator superfamily domain general substrate transporter n=1 Tax=Macrophomina phaseolina TaxID=35725 RepID=A0ABQ8FR28_9PEZI|nr:hypothetical protein B0J12DRAFT_691575 [Macrophomina phaseolina]